MKYRIVLSILVLALFSCGDTHGTESERLCFKEANELLLKRNPHLKGWCITDRTPQEMIYVDPEERRICFLSGDNKREEVKYKVDESKPDLIEPYDKAEERKLKRIVCSKSTDIWKKGRDIDRVAVLLNARIDGSCKKNISGYKPDRASALLSLLYHSCVSSSNHCRLMSFDSNGLTYAEGYYSIDTTVFVNQIAKGCPHRMSRADFEKYLLDSKIIKKCNPGFEFVYFDYISGKVFTGGKEDPTMQFLKDTLRRCPDKVFIRIAGDDTAIREMESAPLAAAPYFLSRGRMPDRISSGNAHRERTNKQERKKGNHDIANKLGLVLFVLAALSLIMLAVLKGGYRKPKKKENRKKTDGFVVPTSAHDSSIERILAEYDLSHGTRYAVKYQQLSEAYDEKKQVYDALAKLDNGQDVNADDVLEVYGKYFSRGASLVKEYNAFLEDVGHQRATLRLFHRIVGARTESELIEALDSLRREKDYHNLPRIRTLSGLLSGIDSAEQPSKQIYSILKEIDEYSGRDLYRAQQSFLRRTISYDNCKKLVKGIDESNDLYTVLAGALDSYVRKGETIDGALDFVHLFDGAVQMKEKSEVLREHDEIGKIVSAFTGFCSSLSQKENLDYWDRMALILASVSKCAIPVLTVVEPDNKLAEQREWILGNIKNDLMLSYISRYFLRDANDEAASAAEFRDNVMDGLRAALSDYNSNKACNDAEISVRLAETNVEEKVDVLESSIGKNRGYEATKAFADGMWEAFVKDFLEHARTCKSEPYIIEQALNIAYHTADFLDHIKGGRDIIYCYNYAFLRNGFDPEKTQCLEFKLHDYTKSTEYSDFIFELAEKYGIEHLKILIDNYFIKP